MYVSGMWIEEDKLMKGQGASENTKAKGNLSSLYEASLCPCELSNHSTWNAICFAGQDGFQNVHEDVIPVTLNFPLHQSPDLLYE